MPALFLAFLTGFSMTSADAEFRVRYYDQQDTMRDLKQEMSTMPEQVGGKLELCFKPPPPPPPRGGGGGGEGDRTPSMEVL